MSDRTEALVMIVALFVSAFGCFVAQAWWLARRAEARRRARLLGKD